MKIPAILKSPRILLFILVLVVVVVLVSRRVGYTLPKDSGTPAPDDFDKNKITVYSTRGIFTTDEDHILKSNKEKKNNQYPYCYSNVTTGMAMCFKSSLVK